MTPEQEMAILDDSPSVLTLGDGVVVDIYKCKVRQLTKVSGFIKTVVKELGVKDIQSEALEIDLNDPNTFLTLFDNCYNSTIELLSSLCSLDRDGVENLELEELLELLMAIFNVNKDFFLKRVMPLMQGRNLASQ